MPLVFPLPPAHLNSFELSDDCDLDFMYELLDLAFIPDVLEV